MSKDKAKLIDKWLAQGFCDERRVGFCATSAGLPDGSFGMVAVTLKDENLLIYDVDGKMLNTMPTRLMRTIPLKAISSLEFSPNLFAEIFKGYSFRFKYGSFLYEFKNCSQNKAMLAAISDAVKDAQKD